MRTVLLFFLLVVPLQAQSLKPLTPSVQGEGTKTAPYVFTSSTICVLTLTTPEPVKGLEWDYKDDLPDAVLLPGDQSLAFPSVAATAIVYARWEGGWSKAYLVVESASPPAPASQLESALRAALVGPDAKADAVQFAAIVSGIADAIETTPPPDVATLHSLWTKTFEATKWPKGKYPGLPAVGRLAIPTTDQPLDVGPVVSNLRLLAKAAGRIK